MNLGRLAAIFDHVYTEPRRASLDRLVVWVSVAGFLIHLLLVFLAAELPSPPALIAAVGTNYLAAIYTPFDRGAARYRQTRQQVARGGAGVLQPWRRTADVPAGDASAVPENLNSFFYTDVFTVMIVPIRFLLTAGWPYGALLALMGMAFGVCTLFIYNYHRRVAAH